MLAEVFKLLIIRHRGNSQQAETLWNELVEHYSGQGRYYHNLAHLRQMYSELLVYKNEFLNFDAILFAVYYHDLVYDVLRKDNEEESANFAEERMLRLAVPKKTFTICRNHILATKTHALTDNADTNLFTDADLSILGQDSGTYLNYLKQVRQEHFVYSDAIYKAGRKKVLEEFLAMPLIFKTPSFYHKYEHQARVNIDYELNML